MKSIITLLLIILNLWFSTSANAQPSYLYCGHLIDCTDDAVKNQMTIIVEDHKIKEIKSGYVEAPEDATLIDLKDKTVLPGLMDMHVHIEGQLSPKRYEEQFRMNDADVALRATVYAKRTLMAGFTTVRDLAGTGVNVSLRNAINKGYVIGPRIYTAEKAIGSTGSHADPTNGLRNDLKGDPGPREGVINGPDEARKAVRQRYKNGADLIKIAATGGVLSIDKDGQGPQFTEEEIKAIVETANDYGFTTAAHAHGPEGMRRAIEAGITSIEHGTLMTPEIMELMKKHGTYYVPTISAGKFVAEKAKQKGYFPALVVPKALAIGPKIQATFAAAYKAGVKIAFGTDTGVSPHGDNAHEFIFMTEAGMPPLEAIKSATVTASELLRKSDILGTIEAGKLADIIAVQNNPLDKIETLLDVKFVMKDGTVYKNE